ncbi:MAG: PTS transporter subunit EIIC [Spirochaetaceae bacterium]|jgi:PTS system beta-glucosides-specific IIC component|nr:PTS transporter subunit EIIC [Spirochaetaceae bacterium]
MKGIAGIFLPVVNVMTASGILKGLIVIAAAVGLLDAAGHTYTILYAMADSVFFFLPMILACTAAKQFGTNIYTALVLGAIMLYPPLTALMDAEKGVLLFGLPVTPVVYSYSVIPVILAAGLQYYIEKLCSRFIPQIVRDMLTPLFVILIAGSAVLLLLGPVGKFIGDVLADGYRYLYSFGPAAAGFCIGALIQVMVIFGLQWGIVPIALQNIALYGTDTMLAFFAPAVFAQIGSALAVFLKTKDGRYRANILTGVVAALFGVTEPILFGVTLPLKKPLAAVCIAGGIGGAIIGLTGGAAMAFAFPSIITLPVFMGTGFAALLGACGIALALSFTMTLLFRFDLEQVTKSKE